MGVANKRDDIYHQSRQLSEKADARRVSAVRLSLIEAPMHREVNRLAKEPELPPVFTRLRKSACSAESPAPADYLSSNPMSAYPTDHRNRTAVKGKSNRCRGAPICATCHFNCHCAGIALMVR